MSLKIIPGDGSAEVVREIKAVGRMRAPIRFVSKDLHTQRGLEVGTLTNDHDHRFNVLVRVRGEHKAMQVLKVEPAALRATLEPLSDPGAYKLQITVPQGAPTTMFNRNDQHGYVYVGDPSDDGFSNWFPIKGAIVEM